MKNRFSALFIVCMMAALMTVMNCRCGLWGCPVPMPKTFHQAGIPTCHYETKGRTVPERCCSKCQIEKNAVLFRNIFVARIVLLKNVSTVTPDFEKDKLSPEFLRFSYKEHHGPPTSFFKERIFVSGLSFRSPPIG